MCVRVQAEEEWKTESKQKKKHNKKKIKKNHTQEEEEKEADEEEGRADWMEKKAELTGRAKRLAISIEDWEEQQHYQSDQSTTTQATTNTRTDN